MKILLGSLSISAATLFLAFQTACAQSSSGQSIQPSQSIQPVPADIQIFPTSIPSPPAYTSPTIFTSPLKSYPPILPLRYIPPVYTPPISNRSQMLERFPFQFQRPVTTCIPVGLTTYCR